MLCGRLFWTEGVIKHSNLTVIKRMYNVSVHQVYKKYVPRKCIQKQLIKNSINFNWRFPPLNSRNSSKYSKIKFWQNLQVNFHYEIGFLLGECLSKTEKKYFAMLVIQRATLTSILITLVVYIALSLFVLKTTCISHFNFGYKFLLISICLM